jgi:hypothetical protein
MVCRLKSTKQEGWFYGRLANGCLWVAFGGCCCGYLPEQIEVKDKSREFRAVKLDDLHGHTHPERGPLDRTDQDGIPAATTRAPDQQPFFDTFNVPSPPPWSPELYAPMTQHPV